MPSPTRSHTQERIETRLGAEQKALIEWTALLRGCSVSEYSVRSAQDAAERDIRDHERSALSARDSRLFIETLLDPRLASMTLRGTARDYRARWRGGDA